MRTRRIVVVGTILTLGVLAAAVGWCRYDVRVGDTAWRVKVDGAWRLVDANDEHLLIETFGHRLVVLARADGKVVARLRSARSNSLVKDGVLLVDEDAVTVRALDNTEVWSVPHDPEFGIPNPLAVDAEGGIAVMYEVRDDTPDQIYGVDLATGDVTWQKDAAQFGGSAMLPLVDPLGLTRNRLLPVALEEGGGYQLLSMQGEILHEQVSLKSYPTAAPEAVVSEGEGEGEECQFVVYTAKEKRQVPWTGKPPTRCGVYGIGRTHAYVIASDVEDYEEDTPVHLRAIDLSTGALTPLDVEVPFQQVQEAVDDKFMGEFVALRTGDVMRIHDAATGRVTWSEDWPGSYSHIHGPKAVILFRDLTGWRSFLGGSADHSDRLELHGPDGDVLAHVTEKDGTWREGNVIDDGQAVVILSNDVVLLGDG